MKRLQEFALLGWFMVWCGATDTSMAQWVSLGPEGGSALAIATNPQMPSTLYIGTNGGGVFKSTNGGTSWSATGLKNTKVLALAIDPRTPSTLYAGAKNGPGVIKSSDGGETWTWTTSGLTGVDVYALAIDPKMPTTLFAGTWGRGIFKSSDGGGSWTIVTSGYPHLHVWALAIDPQTPSTLFAGTDTGIFKSSDGGGNWTTINSGLGYLDVRSLAIDPQTPSTLYAGTYGGGVFKSSDGGRSWKACDLAQLRVFALAIDPQAPATLYAGTYEDGAFKSNDGGGSWTPINSGLTNPYVPAIAINPQMPSTIYAGTYDCIFKSTNGGGNWTASKSGIISISIFAVAIDPRNPSTLYAGTWGAGVSKSSDGGKNWSAYNSALPGSSVWALAIDPQTPTTLYAGTQTGVFKSTDGGSYWANSGLTNFYILSLAIDPQTPTTLYAGTNGAGVFKSLNGGATWKTSGLMTSSYVWTIAIDPQTPTTLYAGTDTFYNDGGGAFKSNDGGVSWTAINNGLPLNVFNLAIDPQVPATLYAGAYNSGVIDVFKTNDGGGSWVAASNGLPISPANPNTAPDNTCPLAIDPQTPSTVYVGTTNGVFRSTNGGGSWSAINTGMTYLDVRALTIDPLNPSRVYEGTIFGGVFVSSLVNCSYFISPTNSSYSSSGITSDRVRVTASDCGWTATSNDPWITITSGSSGVADGVVTYSVAPSVSPDPRTGTMTIAGQTFIVTQAGLTSSFSVSGITPGSGSVTGGTSITLQGGGFQVGASVMIGGIPARIGTLTSDQITATTGTGSVPGSFDVVVTNPGGQSVVLTKGFTYTPVSGPQTGKTFVPIVLSIGGMNGSFYTSELTLTNRGTGTATVNFTYTASIGSGSGTASDTLAPSQQKIVPDAISYLRSLGVAIPSTGGQGGTLGVTFDGLTSPSDGSVTVRTTAVVPEGRAGLAYGGVPAELALTDPSYICGLRQTQADRSNVAVQNVGSPSDGNITLRLTVFSGAKGPRISKVLPDQVLAPGRFAQVNGILTSNGLELSNGYVQVERINGTAPYYAYGVINDQANSDGSFIPPISESALAGKTRMTLPVVVETELFSTELVLSNWSSAPKTLNCQYVADAVQTADHTASFMIELEAGQQLIQPKLVEWLRDTRVAGIGPKGPSYAGALFVTADGGGLSGIAVAARTSAAGGGGEYGLFYTALPEGRTSQNEAWLYGLQQNGENRSNLALVNTSEVDSSKDTFSIELYDGETGRLANTIDDVTLAAGSWKQFNLILAEHASGVQQGYAHVVRKSGNNPFIAYAVINDGAQSGERSGDGAFIASAP